MSQKYDKAGKWLVRDYGRVMLFLGGLRDVRYCKAVATDLTLPRKVPDGLLEVYRGTSQKPVYVLVELATYPESRVEEQARDDLLAAMLYLGHLPDLLVLVLSERGKLVVPRGTEAVSQLGWSRLAAAWSVQELWKLDAEPVLALEDPGVIPWVPLLHFEGESEALVRRCRQVIEKRATHAERGPLLNATQVMMSLRFTEPGLFDLMEESSMVEWEDFPLIKRKLDERATNTWHDSIVRVLRARFDQMPDDLAAQIRRVSKEERLAKMVEDAAKCSDLDDFRKRLAAGRGKRGS